MEKESQLTFRTAKASDLGAIASCHQAAFPASYTTKLGTAYLRKMYEWYLAHDYTFLSCLEENGKIVGYIGGLLKDKRTRVGSASGMTQYSFSAAVVALLQRPWLLFHSDLLSKYSFVLKNIRMKIFGAPRPNAANVPVVEYASLVAIAVHPAHQGKGYGSVLLRNFESIAQSKGFKRLQLSVRSDNTTAVKSYEKNGWVVDKRTGVNLEMSKQL